MRHLLVARHYSESESFASRKKLEQFAWSHVFSPKDFFGVRDVRIVLTGEYWAIEHYSVIREIADKLVADGRATLQIDV